MGSYNTIRIINDKQASNTGHLEQIINNNTRPATIGQQYIIKFHFNNQLSFIPLNYLINNKQASSMGHLA